MKLSCGFFWCALFSASVSAQYDETDHLILNAKLDSMYDSNLFRLSDNESAGGLSRHDFITTPQGALSYRNEFSQQSLLFDLSAFAPRYSLNNNLDYTGYQFSGRWNGQVGADWKPGVQLTRTHKLASFEDAQLGVKDMIDDRTMGASLQYGGSSYAHLRGDVSRRISDHDVASYLSVTEQGWGLEAGLKTSRGSSLLLQHQERQVSYTALSTNDQDYRRHQDSITLFWPVSNKLSVTLSGGVTSWFFDSADASTHSGNGSGELIWQATDKLGLVVSFQREADEPGNNLPVSISNTYIIQSNWQLTERVLSQLIWTRMDTTYGVLSLSDTPSQKNITNSYRWSVDWQPYSALTTEIYAEVRKRTSNISSAAFDDDMAGVNLKFRY